MFDEGRRESLGCFSDLKSAGMRGIGAARAMNEKDGGRWSRSSRSPEVAFKAQIATDVTGEICTRWNERESTWRKSGSCPSRGISQSKS